MVKCTTDVKNNETKPHIAEKSILKEIMTNFQASTECFINLLHITFIIYLWYHLIHTVLRLENESVTV